MKKLTTAIFILLSCTPTSPSYAQTSDRLKKQLETYMTVIHAKSSFSGEILVSKGTDVIFNQSIGMASREHSVKLEPRATYRIASISKTFTATLIAMAQRENKLNYSDKITDHLKTLDSKFQDITIHHLLTHTSGIPHNEAIKDYWLMKSKMHMPSDHLIQEINQVKPLFSPGASRHYSSLGYCLLAMVLEVIHNDSYANILRSQILKKYNLKNTGSGNISNVITGMASGYHLIEDDSIIIAPYRNYDLLKGAGDMYSTAADLLKWSAAFFGDLLSEHERNILLSPYIEISEQHSQGYGWFISQKKPTKYFHGGGTWGYSSLLVHYPEANITAIILANVSTLAMESIGKDIENIVFGLDFSMPEDKKEVAVNDIKKYTGEYVSEAGRKLTIVQNGNNILIQLAGNPAFQIYANGENRFFGKKVEIDIQFIIKDEKVSGLTARRMGETFHFKKL